MSWNLVGVSSEKEGDGDSSGGDGRVYEDYMQRIVSVPSSYFGDDSSVWCPL